MSKKSDFRAIVTSLWFRLITLGIVALVVRRSARGGIRKSPGLDVLSHRC